MAELHHVDIDAVERAVYLRKKVDRIAENDAALKALCMAFQSIAQGAGFVGCPGSTPALWTRLAAAVTALFTDPGFKLSQEGFDQVAAWRAVIEATFKASAFGGTDHLFAMVTEETEGVNKYLLLFSVDSRLGLDLAQIFTASPQETVGLYLSMLGYGQILTPEADARRQMLIELAPAFEDVHVPAPLLNALCSAYMHVSYADCPGKHEPKRVFHRMMARLLEGHVSPPNFGPQIRKDRPTIVLVFDWWWDKHAMYRCYAQSIMQLKQEFRLVGCARNMVTNEASRAMFDDWIAVADDTMILADVAKQILAVQPDIVYYPSIGMSSLTIALSSLRLAPVQVMTYGHPATTHSPEIDYGLIESDIGVQACFSEELVPLPPNTIKFVPYSHFQHRHKPRPAPETVKIAVTAMQVKVGWPFIKAMQEVQRLATKRVEFHFFCAADGVGLYSQANQIKTLLANTMVYEKADYQELMGWIAGCDICLFSFPFGGTNSAIDAMLLEIPFVAYEGVEPHSRTDSTMVRRAGLPESMIATTPEDYAAKVVHLVNDDEARLACAAAVAAVYVPEKFFVADDSNAFLEAFRSIYRSNTVEQAA